MSYLELRQVEKQFGSFTAVSSLNLAINQGEFVVLLGPSGCGKTTTLRMIAGLEKPDRGDILMEGCRVNDVPAGDRNIAFVFQHYALYPHLNVYENLAFPLKAERLPKGEIESRILKVAELLKIQTLLKLRPRELSGGDRQRVALGRAMVRKPRAFLMDEPLGALDASLREYMRTELKKLHLEQSATTIYVTHDQLEAMSLGDKIAIMDQGKLQQFGPPSEIYARPANRFVAHFIGSPGMNFIEGCLYRDGQDYFVPHSSSVRILLDTALAKGRLGEVRGPVVLGARPEHLTLSLKENGGWPGEVLFCEPQGSYNIVNLKMKREESEDTLHARVCSDLFPRPSTPVWVTFQSSQLCLFHPSTGQSLLFHGHSDPA